MAVLGKRKASTAAISQESANDIFRRHFEAQFSPLPQPNLKATAQTTEEDDSEEDSNDEEEEENDDSDDAEEWGGFSDGDDEKEDEKDVPVVEIEIVDHSASQAPTPTAMSKRELKAFMSSRPPDQTTPSDKPLTTTQSSSSSSPSLPEDAPSLLAQDLELRRLLSESHLLAPTVSRSPFGGPAPEPRSFAAGRTRLKATDLRIQALGSKTSIHKQEKMPMHMRKGIVAAADAREAKRRREAKENGVILERETGKKKRRKDRGRDWAVDRPGVGRLKGAELRINDRDVKRIEGSRDVFGRRNKPGRF